MLGSVISFRKHKSPGLDGLTAELYITFWEELKSKLIKVYQDSFTKGILPETMRVGVVTLLENKLGLSCAKLKLS